MVKKMYFVGHFNKGDRVRSYFMISASESGLTTGNCLSETSYVNTDALWLTFTDISGS
jgi:hypothetical protein